MRAVLAPVVMDLAPNGLPLRLHWGGRALRVMEVRDVWEVGGLWWRGEPDREYWLLRAGHVDAEVYRELGGEERWVLSRLAD